MSDDEGEDFFYSSYDEEDEDEEDIYNRKMYEAIENNDISTIEEISHYTNKNESFINHAILNINNNVNINTINKLIELGFKVTIYELYMAIRYCNLNKTYELIVYKLLNENLVKPDIRSLNLSIDEVCNIKIVQLILSKGIKPNNNTLIKVIKSKNSVLIKFFTDNYKNMFNYDLLNSNISIEDKIHIDIIRLIVANEKYINRKNKAKQVPNIVIIRTMIICKNTNFFNVLNEFNILYDIQRAVEISIDQYNYEMIKYFFNNGAILNDSILEYFFSRGYIYKQMREVGNKIISLFYENGLNNDLDSFIKIFNMMHNKNTSVDFYDIISSYMNETDKSIITEKFKNDLKKDLFGGNKSVMLGGAINCCSNGNNTCTICFDDDDDMDYNNAIELKNCKHAFHRKCIKEFIEKNHKIDKICPICRNKFDPDNDILGVEGPLCKEKIIKNNKNLAEYDEIYINTINIIERILDYNLNESLINNYRIHYLENDIHNVLENVVKLQKYNIDDKFNDTIKGILNNTINGNLSENIKRINESNISEEDRVERYKILFLNNIYRISLIIRTECEYSKAIEYINSNTNILKICKEKNEKYEN